MIEEVADMIKELPVGQQAPEKPAAPSQLVKQVSLTQLPLAALQTDGEPPENLLQK